MARGKGDRYFYRNYEDKFTHGHKFKFIGAFIFLFDIILYIL